LEFGGHTKLGEIGYWICQISQFAAKILDVTEKRPSPLETNQQKIGLFVKSLASDQRKIFKQLRENAWWWRKSKIRRKLAFEVDWKRVEESARNYELMRRFSGGEQFPKTYWELGRDERTLVHGLWVNWSQAPYRVVRDRPQFEEKGWSPVYENQYRQWNLRLQANELAKEFIREIKLSQKLQKIRPKHALKGQKFRGVSWKLVEILDCNRHKIGKLNNSERHTLSSALLRAKKCLEQYKKALAAQAAIHDPLAFLAENTNEDEST
jgi:hypothetical protein